MPLFYDRDYGRNRPMGYDSGYRFRGAPGMYDREFGYGAGGMGYDRGYKSRWQTDYGDPFGDRAAHTPMRVIRGGYRGSNPREFGWETDYDRDYAANPMSYEPYYDRSPNYDRGPNYGSRESMWGRQGTWDRGYARGYRPRSHGYDTGWF